MSIQDEIEAELTPCPYWRFGGCFCYQDCSEDLKEIEEAEEEIKKAEGEQMSS